MSLSKDYRGLDSGSSGLEQRREGNNIYFKHKGAVYVNVQSQDYVSLRWRNKHRKNDYQTGYSAYGASSFKLHIASYEDPIRL